LDSAEQKIADCLLRVPEPEPYAAWAAIVGPAFTPVRYAVASKLLAEGEMVRSMPVTNAFKLVINSVLKLRASIPERYSSAVRVGQAVAVRVDAYPDELFQGKVQRVNPTVDSQSRAFQVEISIANLAGRLKAGGFARAAIQIRTDENVPTVPLQAILTFAGVTKIFVIRDGKATPIPVEIGLREREWVELVGAVTPGWNVATSGLSQLVDGSPVKVRE
jgi:RND family efflux transporter MFP subunit